MKNEFLNLFLFIGGTVMALFIVVMIMVNVEAVDAWFTWLARFHPLKTAAGIFAFAAYGCYLMARKK